MATNLGPCCCGGPVEPPCCTTTHPATVRLTLSGTFTNIGSGDTGYITCCPSFSDLSWEVPVSLQDESVCVSGTLIVPIDCAIPPGTIPTPLSPPNTRFRVHYYLSRVSGVYNMAVDIDILYDWSGGTTTVGYLASYRLQFSATADPEGGYLCPTFPRTLNSELIYFPYSCTGAPSTMLVEAV